MRVISRALGALLLFALLATGWDFLGFVDRAHKATSDASQGPADAVTALTGASDARILEGVELAESLKLPLLISGVHVDTSTADIANIVNVPEPEIACCVTLGRAAATTEGNGAEVADWARRFGFETLIVVTSEYHMDRAMLELRRAMPEGTFLPHAVVSTRVEPGRWWSDPPTARRLFNEWIKFRVAGMRSSPQPIPSSSSPANP